jgi:hypothetical protein
VVVEVREVAGSSGQGSSATAGHDSSPKVSSISISVTGALGFPVGVCRPDWAQPGDAYVGSYGFLGVK